MSAVPSLFRRIVRWGQPWHGLMHAETLTLPNASTLPCLPLSGDRPGDTRYFRAPGRPAPATRADESALGMLWTNDVILWGSQQSYSPRVASPLEATWIYWSPGGRRWKIMVEAVPQGVMPRIVSPGAPVFLDVRVTAIEMDVPPSDRTWITLLGWQTWSANTPGFSGAEGREVSIESIVQAVDMRSALCPHPEGHSAYLNWELGVSNTYGRFPELQAYALIALRIDLTGETPSASIALDGSRHLANIVSDGPGHTVAEPHTIISTRLQVAYSPAGERVELRHAVRNHTTDPQEAYPGGPVWYVNTWLDRAITRNDVTVASVGWYVSRPTFEGAITATIGKWSPATSGGSDGIGLVRASNNCWLLRPQRTNPTALSYVSHAVGTANQAAQDLELPIGDPVWASYNPRTGAFAVNAAGPVCWV